MSFLGKFLQRKKDGSMVHMCPACNHLHVLPSDGTKCKWIFNDDLEAPTFVESVKHSHPRRGIMLVCHYNITAGMIFFHGDCTHAMVGQTVPLPELDRDRISDDG